MSARRIQPTTTDYLTTFVNQTIMPAHYRRSNSFFYLPYIGRTSHLRHVSDHNTYISEHYQLDLSDLIWLDINSNQEERLLSAWKQTAKNWPVKISSSVSSVFDFLGEITQSYRILLCFDVVEQPDLEWLNSLHQVNTMQIDWQFSFPQETRPEDFSKILGPLAQYAIQNIWYMPLYNEEDMAIVIDNQVNQGFAEASPEQRQQIIDLSGGYPRIARYFLRQPDKISLESWSDPELKQLFQDLWDALAPETQLWLFKLVNDTLKPEEQPSEFISQTKLVELEGKEWRLFSPLFKSYVEHLATTLPAQVTEQAGVLYLFGQPIESIVSSQEYRVLRHLWEHGGEVVKRDDIAEAIWGEDWNEKYSDWAIDQLIGRLRRKLSDRSSQGLIRTVKGQGFHLVR